VKAPHLKFKLRCQNTEQGHKQI